MKWRRPAEVLLRDQEDPELSDTSPAKISELQILRQGEGGEMQVERRPDVDEALDHHWRVARSRGRTCFTVIYHP